MRDRLIELLKEIYPKTRYIPMEECRAKIADYLLANGVIVPLEKADAVEVKHGEWSLKHIGVGHYWECSECKFRLCAMPRTNYCPNCGAKMDRKE